MSVSVKMLSRRGLAAAALLALAGCAQVQMPGPQSVVGMQPVGSVIVTEYITAGVATGTGTLTYGGRRYNLKLAGGVTGGGGAAQIEAIGDVYNLKQLSDVTGLYTQNSGGVGLDNSSNSDLWLRNKAGVVMHLTGTQQGVVFSLGRDEILIELM